MRIVIVLVLAASMYQGMAQSPDSISIKPDRKVEYFFYVQSGVMIGNVEIPDWCSDCQKSKEFTFSATTIHGVKWGRLRAGGGLGFDSYYGWNTVPVIGSISWDLLGKKDALVVQLNYGASVITNKSILYKEYGLESIDGGMMVNPSIGYRILHHNASLMLNVGFKRQVVQSNYKYITYYWDPILGQQQGDSSYSTLQETLNRFVISLAIGWK